MGRLFLALLFAAASAGAKPSPVPISDDGWDPGSGKGQQGTGAGSTIMSKAPTYSAGDERQSGYNGQDQPNTPDDIASQAMGNTQGGPCDQSAANQLLALAAQVIALGNKAISLGNQAYGCGTNQACYANINNQLAAINAQLVVLKAQIIALTPQAQAEANCTGNSATSAQALAAGR